jgi:hypothetical protein
MRWSRTLILLSLLVLIAACGSSAASADGDGGNGNGNGNGAEESQEPEATATPADGDGGDGDGDGGNGSSGDLEGLLSDLTPPNSSQIQRTEAEGVIFVIWESTDSPESLADFYTDAIEGTGMEIYSTTTAEGSYSWLFAESESSDFGGAVTLVPSSSGGSGSTISVQVGAGG